MTCLRFARFTAMCCFTATAFSAEPKSIKAPTPSAPVTETEIKAVGDATFDAGNHIATFLGGVTVNDPRFTMTAQKLTVYLLKTRDANSTDTSPTGGIDRAVAEGNVEIVQKPTPSTKPGEPPERVSGHSEKATFEPKTGVVVLTGSPIVHRGVNEHIATSPATVMTLTRDGGLRTNGPSKTIIRDTSKASDLTSTSTKKP
jgi:lipopolysaccharide export system protein LptA